MNNMFPIAGAYELSVSVARPVLAATGKDWEGTGVAPTVPAPVEAALATAHVHAVRKLAASAQGERRAALAGLATGLEAANSPRPLAAPPAAYVGGYSGKRRIMLQDGNLWYQQEQRMPRRMVSLGSNQFTLADDPMSRLDFDVLGKRATAFDLSSVGGPVRGRFELER
jgi:hypothetical protein